MIHRWRSASGGLEHAVVQVRPDGIRAVGVVIGGTDARFAIAYRLELDSAWRTTMVRVERIDDGQRLELRSDGAGNWWDAAGRPLARLTGCTDVDLSASPLTNTLPIRRLRPHVGERAEIAVALVDVPALSVVRARQRYTCLDDRTFRFESLDDDFTRELTVDEAGFVVDYPGLFTRLPA